MSVTHTTNTKDLAEQVNRLNLALTLLLQQFENIEEIDKGVLEMVKRIIAGR
jgi:hypothetical protein